MSYLERNSRYWSGGVFRFSGRILKLDHGIDHTSLAARAIEGLMTELPIPRR